MIKLTSDEIKHIGLFESVTGTQAKDCVIDHGRALVTFLVKENQIGMAVGKNGNKIKQLERMIGKNVEVVEFSSDALTFVRNVLAPAELENVEITERGGKRVAVVTVDFQNRRLVIGRRGRKIQNAKKLVFRHHGIEDILLR